MKTCVGVRRLFVEMDLKYTVFWQKKKNNVCDSKRTYAYEKMQLFKDDLVNFDSTSDHFRCIDFSKLHECIVDLLMF